MNRRGDRKFRAQVTLGQLYVLFIRGGGGGGVVVGRGRGGEGSEFWAVIADIIHNFIKHFTP